MSTQSEWVAGEKKKKAGLIGKLKALTKNKDEKEFGSGSDISSVSMTSNMSAFAKAARKRSQSRDRGTSKDREKPKKPETYHNVASLKRKNILYTGFVRTQLTKSFKIEN